MKTRSSDEMSTASALLLNLAARYGGDGPTLVLGGDAALANTVAAEVSFAPTDIRERDAARVPVTMDPEPTSAGTVLIAAPPDRNLLRKQLIVAANAARPGGKIFICGANSAGGKSAIKDATDLLGTPTWSGYREKHRMAIFQPTGLLAASWAKEPSIAPDTWQEFVAETPVGNLTLHTQAGVFAGAKLDAGTRLLLDHLHVEPGTRVLDVGCGVGVIGLLAAKIGAQVTMTDANLLAVQAASHNIASLGLDAHVIASDVYYHLDSDEKFDLIVSNPPFHRGKQVDFTVANEIISGAAERLNPGGSLLIVANAFLAYGKQMTDVFTRVDTVASTPQYHVLRGHVEPS